jgi:hypothetical protein
MRGSQDISFDGYIHFLTDKSTLLTDILDFRRINLSF